jgi:four helix bundle protein
LCFRTNKEQRATNTDFRSSFRESLVSFRALTRLTIHRFEDIESWKHARQLTVEIYTATRGREFRRDFGLSDQIRRASVSIMGNIAEGFGRKGKREFPRYLTLAQASVLEVQSHLYVALDLEYVDPTTFEGLFQKARRIEDLLGGFIRYLEGTAA